MACHAVNKLIARLAGIRNYGGKLEPYVLIEAASIRVVAVNKTHNLVDLQLVERVVKTGPQVFAIEPVAADGCYVHLHCPPVELVVHHARDQLPVFLQPYPLAGPIDVTAPGSLRHPTADMLTEDDHRIPPGSNTRSVEIQFIDIPLACVVRRTAAQ